jgi:uncharacterized protein YqjF (DUF2071 family)
MNNVTNTRPWSIEMKWHDLAFLHWPISKDILRPLIPPALELDTYSGDCWIGVVPFRMTGVRHRLTPAMGWYSDFLELNVRTYVRSQGKSGVWFFSLDAANLLAVKAARWSFQLPYFHATMNMTHDHTTIRYSSRRKDTRPQPVEFLGSYKPTGDKFVSDSNSIEYWLTERYCLYTANKEKKVMRADVHHDRWPLQRGEVEIEKNTMLHPLKIETPTVKPLVHFATYLSVVSWTPEPIAL